MSAFEQANKKLNELCGVKKTEIRNILKNTTMNTADKVHAINEHLENQGYHDDMIYPFDEDTINELFPNPFDALRACHFGDISFSDDYFRFNGYGNIETLSDWQIDKEYEELETDEDE